MANIDIKLSQATEDHLNALATGTSFIDVQAMLDHLGDSLAPLASLVDAGVLTWRQEPDDSFKLFLEYGTTLTFTDASLPFLQDGRFHVTASNILVEQPGNVTASLGGAYAFVFTATGGNRLVLDSVTATVAAAGVATHYAPASPYYDPDLGNVRLAFEGLMQADARGAVAGEVSRITLQADAFVRSATLAGTFDAAGIAGGSLVGRLTDAAIEFHEGSYLRISGATATLDGGTAPGLSLLADAAAFAGDDTIRVELPDTLHDAVLVASGTGNDAVTIAGGGRLHVNAGAGNDVVTVLSGSHFLEGGSGVDTAVYTGKRSEYGLLAAGEALFTTTAGSAARDTLTNFERIAFADTALAFDTEGAAGQAYRLYLSAFGRTPDAAGLGYWIAALDGGASLADAGMQFIASTEFATLYGTGVGNAKFVELLYANVLHRAADKAGYDYWLGALDDGSTGRADMLAAFSESREHRDGVAAAIGNGIDYIPY